MSVWNNKRKEGAKNGKWKMLKFCCCRRLSTEIHYIYFKLKKVAFSAKLKISVVKTMVKIITLFSTQKYFPSIIVRKIVVQHTKKNKKITRIK